MRTLPELSAAFPHDHFCYEAPVYARYIRELLLIEPSASQCEVYFELLESMLEMLRYCEVPQLCEQDRNAISQRACAAWDPTLAPHRRATIMVIVSAIMPHEPTQDWLGRRARDAPADVAAYMLQTARYDYGKHTV